VRDVDLREEHVVVTLADGEVRTTRYLVDATGPAHFLAKRLDLRRPYEPLRKIALFTHCSGIPRRPGREAGDITILWSPSGWVWVIPFANGRTSVGIVGDPAAVQGAGGDDQQRFDALCAQSPSHQDLFHSREQLLPIQRRADWSYRCDAIAGSRFAMLGDAGGFLDPVFSSGVYLGQQGAFLFDEFLGPALAADELPDQDSRARFTTQMHKALERFLRLIHQFYDARFVENVVRARKRQGLRRSLTSLLAGDVYYDDNPILRMGML
jgi:flavin-dependent dehydrogenase